MKELGMHPDHDTVARPVSDDPETHARDAVEAMRVAGTDRPDIERALLGAGRAHARVLARIDGEAEPPR